MSDGERERFEAHMEACASCARYDRVVDRGVHVLADLPEIAPSSDFGAQLHDRILEEEWSRKRSASGASVAVTVSIAAVIGATAWLPLLLPERQVTRLPAIVAQEPLPRLDHSMLLGAPPGLLVAPYSPAPAVLWQSPLFYHAAVGAVEAYPVAFRAQR